MIRQITVAILALIISASSSFAFIPDNESNQPSLCSLCLFVANYTGNMTEVSNQNAIVNYQYDNMNRITNTTSSVYSVCSVVENSYDLNGNRTNITYPGGLSVGYQYDGGNRLKHVTTEYTEHTETITFNYDSASRMTNITYPNGINSVFGYDAEIECYNIIYLFLLHLQE